MSKKFRYIKQLTSCAVLSAHYKFWSAVTIYVFRIYGTFSWYIFSINRCYWLGYFRSKMVEISGFSKLAKVRLVNRLFKYGPTFFINVHMHNLLGIGCSHSKTFSDVWDSFVSWRNLQLNKYIISVMGISSCRLNFDRGKKNEIHDHS
jgi:hypothetical protein